MNTLYYLRLDWFSLTDVQPWIEHPAAPTGGQPRYKSGGTFTAKPMKFKTGGTFTPKPVKVKVGGSFVTII